MGLWIQFLKPCSTPKKKRSNCLPDKIPQRLVLTNVENFICLTVKRVPDLLHDLYGHDRLPEPGKPWINNLFCSCERFFEKILYCLAVSRFKTSQPSWSPQERPEAKQDITRDCSKASICWMFMVGDRNWGNQSQSLNLPRTVHCLTQVEDLGRDTQISSEAPTFTSFCFRAAVRVAIDRPLRLAPWGWCRGWAACSCAISRASQMTPCFSSKFRSTAQLVERIKIPWETRSICLFINSFKPSFLWEQFSWRDSGVYFRPSDVTRYGKDYMLRAKVTLLWLTVINQNC